MRNGLAQAREYLEAAWHCLDGGDAMSHRARSSIDDLIEEIATKEFSNADKPRNVILLDSIRKAASGRR